MKLTAVLLLAGCLQISARGVSQNVTLSEKNARLETIFQEIRKQTGYEFLYNTQMLTGAKRVDINVTNAPLAKALQITLQDQPFSYVVREKTIVITPKPAIPVSQIAVDTPSRPIVHDIHGRVVDSTGSPLAGASILVRGQRTGVQSNMRGEFDLKSILPGSAITVSYTGFVSKTVVIQDERYLYVNLKQSQDLLDQTVVQAYGTTSRRFSVSSISTVTADEIGKQPVSNVLLALDGRVPGLLVTVSNGAPGAYVATQIRGQNTIISLPTAGNGIYDQPLYIVDGVPFAPQNANMSSFLNSDFSGVGMSPLNNLNPANIESVTVLKDADATSIYGSQGANGVIVITTKKGKAGPTALHLKFNTGPNRITRNLDMYNTQQYLQMRRQAMAMDGLSGSTDISYFPDLLVFDTTKYTNWAKKFFGGTSNNTDVYASVSGGAMNNTFIISGGYTRSTFNFPGNFSDDRWTLHSGFHHSSQDHRFTMDFSNDLSYDRNNSSATSGIAQALTMAPDLPDLIDPSGKLVWAYKGFDLSQYQILSALKTPYLMQSFTSNNSLRLAYQIADGLSFSTGLGYSIVYAKQYSAGPLNSQNPAMFPSGTADFGTSDFQTLSIEPQLDYKKNFGRGMLTALVGATYRDRTSSSNEQDGTGYTDDALLRTIQAAALVTNTDNYSIVKYAGVFGRLGFVYDKKYIVSLTGRRDGSSNFGPDHLFGNFGSAGLGWIFSEEKGFHRLLPFISYAKLAGNYGTTGSDGVAPYQFQPFWKLANQYTYPLFEGIRAMQPVNLSNPDYGWATKKAINLSLDLGFFHDRLLVNTTVYQNRTSNQLTSYPLPSQAGMNSVVENFNATLQDRGWEISITSINIKTKDFRWTTTFNISANHNKLVAFPNIEKSSYAGIYQVGKSTSLMYGFRFKGINDTTGAFQFYTAKGVPTYTPSYRFASQGGDMVELGNTEPKYYGGMGNTFTYKGWSLGVFLHFSDALARNWLAGVYSGTAPGGMSNLPAKMKLTDFWQQPGDKVALQRLTTGSYMANANGILAQRTLSYFTSSSAVFGDDFYIRLQTLSLSYNLPAAAIKKVGLKNCSININAQNLFTITNYKFGDPQTPGSFITVPLQRIITGGVSLDF